MSTLQEQLRAMGKTHDDFTLAHEAADRLDALEREVEALRELVEMMGAQEGAAVFTTETRRRINAARSKT